MAANTNGTGGARINPPGDSEVTVEAGRTLTLAFDITNDSPEIVSYRVAAEQVPSEWIADAPVMDAAPGTNDRVRIVLRPFANAVEGVYPARLSLTADGAVFATVSLRLRVLAAPAAEVSFAPPAQVTPLPDAPTEPTLDLPVPDFTSPRSAPPPPIPPPVAPPAPPPQSGPAPDSLPLADDYPGFRYEPHTQEIVTDEPDERNVVVAGTQNSGDGEVFAVTPGETLLVRLMVQNDGATTRNFVLEDDQLLDVDWLDLRQYDISLDKNAVGELRFRLTPPADAEPGAYPFGVRFGSTDAARRIRQFTLQIPALPAVRLSAEKPTVVSPFGTGAEAEFALQVASVGNADTGFRVGVVSASGAPLAAGSDTPYLYESEQWRYLFDREIDDVRAGESRQPARPETVHLRLVRKGIWWLGWREAHQVTVAATPVMAGAMDGAMDGARTPGAAPHSEATLTHRRWRVLPFPAFVLAPLLILLLPLIGGGAGDIVVENGVPGTPAAVSDTAESLYYVLQNAAVSVDPAKPARPLSADLQWTASPGAWLALWTDESRTLASGPFARHYSDTVPVREYGLTRGYTVGSLWSRQSVTVRFLPLRTASLKIVVQQKGQAITPKKFTAPGGIDGGGREYGLARTGGPATVTLRNGYPNGLDVVVWEAASTGGAGVSGIATVDAKRLAPLTTLPTITLTPPASGSAEVVLLTTDAQAQLVRLRFE